jgi:hypothetical protein
MFPAHAMWSFSDDMYTVLYLAMSSGSSLLAEEWHHLVVVLLLHIRLRVEKVGATTGRPLLLRHRLTDG